MDEPVSQNKGEKIDPDAPGIMASFVCLFFLVRACRK